MAQRHSYPTANGRAVWYTERLWHLSQDLPVRWVAIAEIAEFDQNCWFGVGSSPTCRKVAEHARRIYEADLDYPILLSAEGRLMDGGHRVGKAWLIGMTTVKARQFVTNPEPDYILPVDDKSLETT